MLLTGMAFFSFLVLWNLGKGSIDLRDEALTAGRSLYVYHTGSILDIKVNGELSVRKPPLVYVLTAVSYRLFGINELGLRLPNAIFGIATVAITTLTIYRILGLSWAWLVPWLMLGGFNLIRVSREALTDTAFTFGMTLAFCAVLLDLFNSREEKPKNYLHASLFSIGVFTALFSKGILGLYAPVFSLPFLWIKERHLIRRYAVASILAICPFIIWIVAQGTSNPQFWNVYLGQEYLERINYHSSFLQQFIRTPFWYATNFWRWLRLEGVITICLTLWIYIRYKKNLLTNSSLTPFLYATFAWLGYFLICSVASHKSRRYILPIFPLITICYIFGIKLVWELSRDLGREKIVAAIVSLTIIVGIIATLHHYTVVPDYLPERKAAALAVKPFAEKGCLVATDDPRLAPILHFYLDRKIALISAEDAKSQARTVFIKGVENTSKRDKSKEEKYKITISQDCLHGKAKEGF